MSKREDKLRGEIGVFIRQYKRKAHPTHDPNDRRYDRELEAKIKTMDAVELGELISGESEEMLFEEENAWLRSENPEGVTFSLNQSVQVHNHGSGAVISLLKIRPEPKYLVELGSGKEIEVYQHAISENGT